jgi:hypothetical protein
VELRADTATGSRKVGGGWPRQWTTFLAVDDAKVDLTKLTDVPATLPGRAGAPAVAGRRALLRDDRIDFEQLGGKIRERETAVVMATVTSAADQTVRVGASADWWMQWAVNGRVAYSTLDRGNGGGYGISDHAFDLPLRKGRNLIAVKAQSGSMGWKLLVGAPDRLAALTGDPTARGVQFQLDQPGRSPQTVVADLRRVPVMAAWPGGAALPTLGGVDAAQPDFVLLDHVDNAFAKLPDATKWWRGAADVSARGWVRADGDRLIVAVAVTDDAHRPAGAADTAERGDAVRLSFAGRDGSRWAVAVAPGVADGDAACAVRPAGNAAPPSASASAAVRREGQTTFYAVAIALPDAAARPEFVDVDVFDQDDVPAKQRLSLSPPASAGTNGWYRLVWPGR